MEEQSILRLASMGVALVALIVAGWVVTSSYLRYNDKKDTTLITIITLAIKGIVGLALVAVAFKLSTVNFTNYGG